MKKGKIWMIIALLSIGCSGGIVIGVVVDADQVYHTTIKKIRQKKSPEGSIVVDVEAGTGEVKTNKEIRQEKKDDRQEDRQIRKAQRKLQRQT